MQSSTLFFSSRRHQVHCPSCGNLLYSDTNEGVNRVVDLKVGNVEVCLCLMNGGKKKMFSPLQIILICTQDSNVTVNPSALFCSDTLYSQY